jgi:circadian clock protein KaiC
MRSIGLNLDPSVASGTLKLHADRPSRFGLEEHLATVHRTVRELKPSVVVIDPITNLLTAGTHTDVHDMLTRIIDYLKVEGITALFTSLTHGGTELQETDSAISSLMDTWVLLTMVEVGSARHRQIAVLKSRGMAHSNQIREFALADHGFEVRGAAAQPPVVPAHVV